MRTAMLIIWIGDIFGGKIDSFNTFMATSLIAIFAAYYEYTGDADVWCLLFEEFPINLGIVVFGVLKWCITERLTEIDDLYGSLSKIIGIIIIYYQAPLFQLEYIHHFSIYHLIKAILFPFK